MEKTKKQKTAEWPGYSMDDLAYHRAITLARIELTKERMAMDVDHIKKGNFFLSGSWFGRIMKMVNYTDVFVIGMSLWRKLSPLFSRKKKNS